MPGCFGNTTKCVLGYYLVDSKADGVEVSSKLHLLTHVFLHQTNQKRAAVYSIMGVIIHLIQFYHKLGV